MGLIASSSPAVIRLALLVCLFWSGSQPFAFAASSPAGEAPAASSPPASSSSIDDAALAPSIHELRERTYELFRYGWDAYLEHAYPMDELKPLSCSGLGPGKEQPGSVNDVCGNFSLTLIDVADTLAVMGDRAGFERAVQRIIEHVSFDQDAKVQVFEVTIRVLGGLLSTHQLALPNHPTHPGYDLPWYRDELLHLAVDLADRLLPAFRTPTGIPLARVNLRGGIEKGETLETCSAGAGSLLLEWIVLSRLTGDLKYEEAATKAFWAVWNRRSAKGLVGNAINAFNGLWIPPLISHVGAGVDSFIEYAFKAYVMTGEDAYYDVFKEFYGGVMTHVRDQTGFWYRGAALETGDRIGLTVDSLAAFLPGLQVLAGDVESAIKSHLVYWNLWKRYGGIPESFHVTACEADNLEYPFRPEFVESTYYLYLATKDPFYLDVGEQILDDLEEFGKVFPEDGCGLAGWTLASDTGARMDRMESFALSETLKYLYLLFNVDIDRNDFSSPTVFSTEGHLLFLPPSTLKTPSATRRALRKGENLQCFSRADAQGFSLGVRGRADWDFARNLTCLPLSEKDADSLYWRLDGWCALPDEDAWTVEVMFSSTDDEEDPSPGRDKLRPVAGGAELLQTKNIRAKITKRLDGQGYDLTHIGQLNLHTGQTLWITDPAIVEPFHAAVAPSATPSPPPVAEDRDPAAQLRIEVGGAHWRTAQVGTATFGGVVSPAPAADAYEHPAVFVGSPSIPLDVAPLGHQLACQPLPPASSPPKDHLLLVKRGGCTFAQKLIHARQAGASGILIWDPHPSPPTPFSSIGLIQPSSSDADWPNGVQPATAREVILFLPYLRGAGKKLDTLLREQREEVLVSVEPIAERSDDGRASRAVVGAEAKKLFVGRLPVMNVVVGPRPSDSSIT